MLLFEIPKIICRLEFGVEFRSLYYQLLGFIKTFNASKMLDAFCFISFQMVFICERGNSLHFSLSFLYFKISISENAKRKKNPE